MAEDKKPERDEKSLVTKFRESVESYWRATVDVRTAVRNDFDFVVGGTGQWRADDINKLISEKRPILSFNACQPVVNFLAGYQAEREQDPRAFPKGTEDEQLSRITTSLLKHAMDVTHGPHELHTGFRKGIIGGQIVFEVGHSFDYTDDLVEGDATLTALPENGWYCDPGARRYDRMDAAFQGKLPWMSVEAAKAKWPEKSGTFSLHSLWDGSGADPKTTGVPDHLLTEFYAKDLQQIRVIQHWYRVPVKAVLLINTARSGQQAITRMPSEKAAEEEMKRIRDEAGAVVARRFRVGIQGDVSMLTNVETGQAEPYRTADEAEERLAFMKEQEGTAATAMYRVTKRDLTALRVAHLTAWDLLDDGPSPDLDDWRYRFAPFTCYQDLDDYGSIKGIIRDIKDPQYEINWNYATLLDTMIRAPKGQTWFTKADHTEFERFKREGHRPGFAGEYVSAPPVYNPPVAWSQGFANMIAMDLDAVMRTSGINAELLGSTTQKTVSGRAIQARQSGGLVGVASLLMNWHETKKLIYALMLKRIQQFYSTDKMARVVGDQQRYAQAAGLLGRAIIPDAEFYERLKRVKQTDFDIEIGFIESSPTARQAVFTQMLQLASTGIPVPPDLVVETSDVPFKSEILESLKKQGMGPPNEALAKIIGAAQGAQPSQPDGVNRSR